MATAPQPSANAPPQGVIKLFATDTCPFAQRAWIALLEKEANPSDPKLFSYVETNYYNSDLADTKELFAISPTVPAAVVDGQKLPEGSLGITYWVDEHFAQNPLQPADEEGKAKMKAIIDKFTSGQFDVTGGSLFPALNMLDEEAARKAQTKLLDAWKEFSKEVKGPYLLGSQFTIADIALISFAERASILLPHYKSVAFPPAGEEFDGLRNWIAACMARPSVKITASDRLPRSLAVQPFAKTKRAEYVAEAFESMVWGVKPQVKKQLKIAPPGVATADIPAALKMKEQEEAKKE